jgi:hypothetical protein
MFKIRIKVNPANNRLNNLLEFQSDDKRIRMIYY